MNCATLPALSFGVFDHLDHAGGSLRQQYSNRLEIASSCDEAGFRGYHVAEHHGTPHGLAASPNLFLSAVAQRTKRLRVGPLVMLLNLYHPLRAFEEICMLDQLSGGRLDLGIGRGGVPLELSFFGVSPAEAQDRYNEAVEIIIKAMETDALTYCGRHFNISDVPITLSPIQKPHPPLWYGTTKPETARWAAENSINIACVGKRSAIRLITDAYRAHWIARPAQDMPLLGMVRKGLRTDTKVHGARPSRVHGVAYASVADERNELRRNRRDAMRAWNDVASMAAMSRRPSEVLS